MVTTSVYYIITTNRGAFSEFAYKQFLKFPGAELVILDNSEKGIEYWKNKRVENKCEHHHIPQCENVSQMYNWFVSQYKNCGRDIFYMDDDIELSPEIGSIKKWLHGFDYHVVFLNKVYVTNTKLNKSGIWVRKERSIGAAWLARNDIWPDTSFDPSSIEGVRRFHDNIRYRTNRKYIYDLLANYLIHGSNAVLGTSKFDFNLDRVYL